MSRPEKNGSPSRVLPLFSSFQSSSSQYPPQHRPRTPAYSPVTPQMANAIPPFNMNAPQTVNIVSKPPAQQSAPAPQVEQKIFPNEKLHRPLPSGRVQPSPVGGNVAPQSPIRPGQQSYRPIISHGHPGSIGSQDTSDTRPLNGHPQPDHAPLQAQPKQQQQTPAKSISMPEPPAPKPIDLTTNPDAIALRAAMSILKMQRRQAEMDILTLSRQRDAALQDPKAFAEALTRDEVKMRDIAGTGGLGGFDDSEDDEDAHHAGCEMSPSPTSPTPPPTTLNSFGPIPTPQNVVRTPRINWAKYHIMPKPLENMHQSEIKNPTEGRPRTDEDLKQEIARMQGLGRQGESVVAAPYDPWKDELAPKAERPVSLGTDPAKTKNSSSISDRKSGRRKKPGKKTNG